MSSSEGGKSLRELATSLPVAILGALAIVVAVTWVTVWMGDRDGGKPATASAASQLPSGAIQIAGVEVLEPVSDAGQVPLNTPVERTWRLRNTGAAAVKLGRPGIEVLEGC